MVDVCRLCEEEKELRLSHVLPSFLFKWKKKHGTGFFRTSENPNKRIHDGLKMHLLCSDCEQIFGVWEKQFAERFFKPFHEKTEYRVKYSDWLIKFAISVSWRILIYHKIKGGFPHLSDIQIAYSEKALSSWRNFLLGRTDNIGNFEQHLIPVGIIKSYREDNSLSPYLNRYFVGSVDTNLLRTPNTCLIYSKLNKLIVIGIIQQPIQDYLEGTRIEYPSGEFKPRSIGLPPEIFDYFNKQANLVAQLLSTLSEKQWSTISKSYENDIDRLKKSDIYVATGSDVSISGQAAFNILESKHKK